MFQNAIRHVPVIHQGEILGIIGIKEIADSVLGVSVSGGKLIYSITILTINNIIKEKKDLYQM